MEIKRGDDRLTPLPDGPLALALPQLRLNDAKRCPLCQIRLADLRGALAWRNGATAKLAKAEASLHEGAFDAGLGRTGEIDAQGRLVRLIWSPDQDQHRLDVMLGNYQPIKGSSASFPMRLSASLSPTLSVQYTIEKIDLSPSFSDDTFNVYSTARKFFYTTVAKDGSVHTAIRSLPALPPPASAER